MGCPILTVTTTQGHGNYELVFCSNSEQLEVPAGLKYNFGCTIIMMSVVVPQKYYKINTSVAGNLPAFIPLIISASFSSFLDHAWWIS